MPSPNEQEGRQGSVIARLATSTDGRCTRPTRTGARAKAWYPLIHAEASLPHSHRGQGESLVPPYTRGSISLMGARAKAWCLLIHAEAFPSRPTRTKVSTHTHTRTRTHTHTHIHTHAHARMQHTIIARTHLRTVLVLRVLPNICSSCTRRGWWWGSRACRGGHLRI